MTRYYSVKTGEFYDSHIHKTLPDDAVKIDDPNVILATRQYVDEAIQEAHKQSDKHYWKRDEKIIPDMQDGYQVLPSGLILQWGGVEIPAGGDFWASFPIAFSDDKFRVWITDYGNACHSGAAVTVAGNSTGFKAYGRSIMYHDLRYTTAHWLALGR